MTTLNGDDEDEDENAPIGTQYRKSLIKNCIEMLSLSIH